MLKLWPDAQETLLLQAALADGYSAITAFSAWQAGVDWADDLEGGSFRLLPLVHANLARAGYDDPIMARLRGIYRYSWCAAQGHLANGVAALGQLRAADIPVIVSKGLALATCYYDSPALRPMSDIDLLVPANRALDAVSVLNAGGWHEFDGSNEQWGHRREDMLALIAGLGLRHPRFGEIDLHWRLLRESGGEATDAMFWRDAQAAIIGGVDTLRPSPTHMLFHVIVHGLQPNVMSPLRWIADAAMVLRRDGDAIDWNELLACGRRLRVSRRLGSGLAYLAAAFQLPIPPEIANRRTLPSWVERLDDRAFRARAASLRSRSVLDQPAAAARLLISDDRRHFPRLALRWTARRLMPRPAPR